jgi:membrane protein
VGTPVHGFQRFLLRREEELSHSESLPSGFLSLISLGRFVSTVLVEFLDDHCMQMAAALSYSSLLALVPAATLFFSIFTAFSAFEQLRGNIEGFITEQLFANVKLGQQILAHVEGFSINARDLGLTALVALIVTVIFLMITVENSLNQIWKVPTRRKIYHRVVTYTAMVFLAPLMMAFSFYLTNQTIRTLTLQQLHINPGLWKFVSGFSISCLMFFFVYLTIPEAKVRLRPALLGGIVAGALFEWAKWGFDQYLRHSAFYFDVYKTLALVPIFLVWLYLAWLITMLGMEITYVSQNEEQLRAYARCLVGDVEVTEAALIATMVQIAKNFFEGCGEYSSPQGLANELGIPLARLLSILEHLKKQGFVNRLAEHSDLFTPSRPLSQITVHDLISSLHSDQIFLRLSERDPRFVGLRDSFIESQVFRDEIFESMSLDEVVSRGRKG